MLTFAIVAAIVVAWLFVGVRYTAPRAIGRSVRNRIALHESVRGSYSPKITPAQIAEYRREAVADNLPMIALGPIPLAFFALYDFLYRSAPLTEIELKAQLAEREKQIAELERELGIDSRTESQKARDRQRNARERARHTP